MADVIHELKTWPVPFAAVLDGSKTYEIRVADRPYAVGDVLHLREWTPHTECRGSGRCWDNGDTIDCCSSPHGVMTGRECRVEVTYLTTGGEWGLPANLCVMSIRMGGAVGPPARVCHGGDRCTGWPECESCGPVRQ
jgi:hypothetical protein